MENKYITSGIFFSTSYPRQGKDKFNINTQIDNNITYCRDLISAEKISKNEMSTGGWCGVT